MAAVLVISILLTACSSSAPNNITVRTNSENSDFAVYFMILNKNNEAIKVSGTAKLIIYGDKFKSKSEDTVIFSKELSLSETDFVRISIPGYKYVTKRELESGKLDPNPWGYKWSIPFDEIQHSRPQDWWVEMEYKTTAGKVIMGSYKY